MKSLTLGLIATFAFGSVALADMNHGHKQDDMMKKGQEMQAGNAIYETIADLPPPQNSRWIGMKALGGSAGDPATGTTCFSGRRSLRLSPIRLRGREALTHVQRLGSAPDR